MITNPPTNNVFSRSVKDRFWSIVLSRQGGECWVWDGALSKNGYGQFHLNGKTVYAHITSWIMHYGKIPDNLFVLHKCDNKRCVNPLHLYLGTRSDNAIDWVNRSKMARRGKRFSKFSRADAEYMQALHNKGESYADIGSKYNVDPKTVWNIVNGETRYFAEDRKWQ